jgi:TonB family protein
LEKTSKLFAATLFAKVMTMIALSPNDVARLALDRLRPSIAYVLTLARNNPRALAIGFVGILHVILLYVFILSMRAAHPDPTQSEMQLSVVSGGARAPRGAKPRIDLLEPKNEAVPEPVIDVDSAPPAAAIALPYATGGAAVSMPAEAIGETHTSPPLRDTLLALARRALLRLHLMVGADGSVTAATVDSSSGSQEVDAIAVAWVKTHWRFKPAFRDGQAIAVPTTAIVPF